MKLTPLTRPSLVDWQGATNHGLSPESSNSRGPVASLTDTKTPAAIRPRTLIHLMK